MKWQRIKPALLVIAAWTIALLLVYVVYLKVKLLINN